MSARILVVDDVPANVKLLEAKLSAEYYEVLTASNGPEALALAEGEGPDLILLDVMMPEMDGFEVCRRLKASPGTSHIPVIMVTALSDVSDRVSGLEAGADDFLSKPVNDVALFARVRSLLRLKMMLDELRLRQETSGDLGALAEEGNIEDDAPARVLLIESNPYTASRIQRYLTGEAPAPVSPPVSSPVSAPTLGPSPGKPDGASLGKGYEIVHALTAEEGRARGREEEFDLVIAGLEIEGEDGLRLASYFRSYDETRHLPILLVLEEMDLPRLAKGLDLGVNDYLVKPIDRGELLARARTQVRRRRYHNRLRQTLQHSVSMAFIDPLTGLYNRRYALSHLERKIAGIRDGSGVVSVALFDIDRFKLVNDTYGHSAGDKVLGELSKRVSDNLRSIDLVARIGGEEFLVVMPETPLTLAEQVCERLRSVVGEAPFVVEEAPEPLKISISLGVATVEHPGEGVESVMRRADAALYRAKQTGRNRIAVDHPQPSASAAVSR